MKDTNEEKIAEYMNRAADCLIENFRTLYIDVCNKIELIEQKFPDAVPEAGKIDPRYSYRKEFFKKTQKLHKIAQKTQELGPIVSNFNNNALALEDIYNVVTNLISVYSEDLNCALFELGLFKQSFQETLQILKEEKLMANAILGSTATLDPLSDPFSDQELDF